MTLRRQADSSSGSTSSSSSSTSSSSGSSNSSDSSSSSSDTDSSASESPKPRGGGPAVEAPPPPPAPPAEERAPAAVAAAEPERRGNGDKKEDKKEDRRKDERRKDGPPPRRRSSAGRGRNGPASEPRPHRTGGARRQASKGRPDAEPEAKRPPKKKSIFSPDNSSESDRDRKDRPAQADVPEPAADPAPETRRPKTSASSDDRGGPGPGPDPPEPPARRKRGNAAKKPPDKKKPERDKNDKFPSKPIVSSTSSSASGSSSASSSDAESSAPSLASPAAPKKAAVVAAKLGRSKNAKPEPVKTEKNMPTKDATVPPCTDSDVENTKPVNNTANITRKLTRSASARKSRHVVGKVANTDTESETDNGPTKRPISKSPVKRTTVSSKGPPALLCPIKSRGGTSGFISGSLSTLATGAISRNAQQTSTSSPHTALPEREKELRCILSGCDSLGHLSGRLDRHFTLEACPMYHNMTAEECREQTAATWHSQDTRRRAQDQLVIRRTVQPSLEHRAYQLKVKEMRSKWKPVTPSSSIEVKQEKDIKEEKVKINWSLQQEVEREPVLTGYVPDYDLSLFREAQAAAAYKIEEELKNMPPSKGTRYVCMGKYRMEAWYQSPYPPDAARLPQLYLCEFCLNHHKTVTGINRHRAKCVWKHPPGDEVYRNERLGVWQVDGRRHKQYCQQLCLLAKFFLDHKTLYYDVEPFLFYVMTLTDNEGCHTVGYFSKEKNSLQNYNVSCILTLPPYQRQGYGRLLIDFSYLLTRVEGKIGSPEKPLSDLGLISYRSYWKDVLLQYLCDHPGSTLSIRDLSQQLAINSYDIVSTLQALGMMKYWKGKHIILKRQDVLDEYIERTKRRGQIKTIDRTCLKWTPFVPPSSQGGG